MIQLAQPRAWTLIVLALLCGCGNKKQLPEDVRLVRTTVVDTGFIADHATYTGEIRPRYESDLSFRVDGKLIARPVDVGSVVNRGTVLARLDPADAHTATISAQSGVTAARAVLERARSDETRNRELLERGLVTRSTYVAQQTESKSALASLEQAQAEWNLRRQQLAYTTLHADSSGLITRVSANVGAVVTQGQTIATLAQPAELEVVFDVAESQIDSIRNAMPISASLLSSRDKKFAGHVREVSPTADPVTRTYRVKTTLDNPPSELRMGMSAIVDMQLGRSVQGIQIPSTALYTTNGKPAVWLVGGDKTVSLKPIVIERHDTDTITVLSGINAGQRIITAGVHRLIAGQKVQLLPDASK